MCCRCPCTCTTGHKLSTISGSSLHSETGPCGRTWPFGIRNGTYTRVRPAAEKNLVFTAGRHDLDTLVPFRKPENEISGPKHCTGPSEESEQARNLVLRFPQFTTTTPTQTVTTPPGCHFYTSRRHSQVSRSAFDRRLCLVACFVSHVHPLMVTSDTTQQLDG